MTLHRRKTNRIWAIGKTELIDIVNKSESYSDILRAINLSTNTSNFYRLRERLDEENIDYKNISDFKVIMSKLS